MPNSEDQLCVCHVSEIANLRMTSLKRRIVVSSKRRYKRILVVLMLLLQIYFLTWSFGKTMLQASDKIPRLPETSAAEKAKSIRCFDSNANISGQFSDLRAQKPLEDITRRKDPLPKFSGLLATEAKPTDKPSIDMVNDYYPYVDFKFVFPDISPNVETTGTSNIFMIILVNSGAKGEEYRKQRQIIRQTWGNRSNCELRRASKDKELKHLRWLLVFVIGKAGPETNDDKLNMDEARQHNDMLIGNISDNYINNIIKFYMGQIWASRFDIKYTLKTDDDVYVRIPRVLKYLVNAKFPKPFYGGYMLRSSKVKREIENKWAISWKYYADTHYANYSPGAFFILSSDLLNRLFNYVYKRKLFHTDDAYVGVAIRDLGVNATNIPSFALKKYMNKFIGKFSDCHILGLDAIGHDMGPETIASETFNRPKGRGELVCGRRVISRSRLRDDCGGYIETTSYPGSEPGNGVDVDVTESF